jgi:mannitol/fructose-specific phosphotransferase system IIA component (Ntr-type)
MLSDFITLDRIQIVDNVASWQDAVRLAAQPLLKDASISDAYLQDVLSNIERNGPYIVLKAGFALPHAQAKDGSVSSTCMSCLIVQEGVDFSDSPAHNAKVLIFLAATHVSAHMEAMGELVDKLADDNWLVAMSGATSAKAVADLLD